MNRWFLGSRQARLDDPLEYEGNRRRTFWDVMAGRAARGNQTARENLEARAAWQDKLAARAEHD